MKRGILILILAILIPFSLSLSSCRKEPRYRSGDFVYRIIKENEQKMAAITGLSEQGAEKEVIEIPEYLDGYKVYGMYDKSQFSRFNGRLLSQNLKKVYVRYEMKINQKSLYGGRLFYFYPEKNNVQSELIYFASNIEIASLNPKKNSYLYNADVTYYNWDDSIYWIDDYNNSLIQYPPKDPEREGYTFDGWYKEKECINKWDFEVDIVPEKEYNKKVIAESEKVKEYIYKETKLYAKWI